ncbi:hypothetical protein [Rhodococcus globerulus]|uniref:Transposase n=1 Tax=Rhodococcus globerulus TaxID=33008 RepID=A0ABU4C4G9_RHOGO|nr:hypothetical protein [Rhodococcus globerulus]MDV6271411.1 hypothetical protein [Rhodococcus globerulus]
MTRYGNVYECDTRNEAVVDRSLHLVSLVIAAPVMRVRRLA